MQKAAKNQKTDFKDSGFSSGPGSKGSRLINHDGSFNVSKQGIPFLQRFSLFHELINMSWMRFNASIIASFILVNVFFTCLYLIIGKENIAGLNHGNGLENFLNVFYFSTQTFTTVGYGTMSPIGNTTSFLASLHALSGLMGFALATGLIYGRFSRPEARILFSDNILVSPYKDGSGLMFRLANARDSQMSEVEIKVMLSWIDLQDDGRRKFATLPLERNEISFFPLSWTVVHPIDNDSPLYNLSLEDIHQVDMEALILLKGYDDTFNQVTSTRSSYKGDEFKYGYKFDIIYKSEAGQPTSITLNQISSYHKVAIG